jgi:hypothetical protein
MLKKTSQFSGNPTPNDKRVASYITGDSWYSSLENLNFLRNEKVGFLFGIANNRQVSIEKGKALPVKDLEIPEEGLVVYLKSFGWVKVFGQQFKNEPQYYIVYHRDLDVLNQTTRYEFKSLHDSHWPIEEFHRVIENLGLKPRRFTAALLLNISTFTKYMLECETWKKPTRSDFTPHPNKSRYCGALWAV